MERTSYEKDVVAISSMDHALVEQFDVTASQAVVPSKPFDMKEMIALTEDLTALLEQESMLLKEGRIAEVSPLREKKEALASALDTQKRRLNQNPSVLNNLDEVAQGMLEKVIGRFTDSALENKRRIEAARSVNQRIFSMIGKAAQRVHKHTPYTALGRTAAAPKHAIAMKVNERI